MMKVQVSSTLSLLSNGQTRYPKNNLITSDDSSHVSLISSCLCTNAEIKEIFYRKFTGQLEQQLSNQVKKTHTVSQATPVQPQVHQVVLPLEGNILRSKSISCFEVNLNKALKKALHKPANCNQIIGNISYLNYEQKVSIFGVLRKHKCSKENMGTGLRTMPTQYLSSNSKSLKMRCTIM